MTKAEEYRKTYNDGLAQDRGNLERFLAEDGTNVFDQKIWTDKPLITTGDVNSLLDSGAVGLEWFRLALVRYHRVWDVLGLAEFKDIVVPALPIGGSLNGAETIDATADPNKEMQRLEGKYYDLQRRMNLTSLQDLASAVRGAASGTQADPGGSQITSSLQQLGQVVPEYWEGKGGVAASEHLNGFHAHADQQTQYLQALTSALDGLPEVLRQIVADKANFIAGFDSPQCPVAGHAMRLGDNDPVSVIITVAAAKEGAGALRNDLGTVAAQFNLPAYNAEDSYKKELIATCKDWLINHFGIAVREAFTAFVHECTYADYYIRQAYKPVIDLLDSHDTTPFPKPPGGDTPSQPSPAPAPGVPGPGPAPGPATTPASTTPTTPAGTQTNPAQQLLSSLASQASQTVQQGVSQALQQGLSQIQNVAQQGLGALGGNLSGLGSQLSGAGSQLNEINAPGTKELANLSAFGGNLTVSQAADGTITAKVTGPDGKPQEYSMGIKDGVPFLKPGPAESDPAATDPSQGADPGKSGGGSGSGVPGGGGDTGPAQSEGGSPKSTPGHSMDPGAGKPNSSGVPQQTGPANPDAGQSGTPGMPGPGMPGPGPGGGKPGPDGERSPNGMIPPKPLWTTVPGEGVPNPDGTIGPGNLGPELATVGPLDGAPPAPTPGPELATSGPLNAPGPPEQANAPTSPTPPARPASGGVKIEIDTGDAK